jgi:hypothetical protein
MSTMDLGLAQIQSLVAKFRSLLPNGAYSTAQPDVAAQAKQLMVQIAGYLNIQDGSRYVFGGTNSSSPPVDLSNLPVGAAATLTQLVNGPPASNGYYAGGAATAPARIDTRVTVDYGITANDSSGFRNSKSPMKRMSMRQLSTSRRTASATLSPWTRLRRLRSCKPSRPRYRPPSALPARSRN